MLVRKWLQPSGFTQNVERTQRIVSGQHVILRALGIITSHSGTTFLYEFCFDAAPIGAAHTTEIPLVFGTLDSPIGSALYGSAPTAEAVSREMSGAWRAFATDGDPGWPAYDSVEQLTRVFDTKSRTTPYPEQAAQQIWASYPFDPFTLQR